MGSWPYAIRSLASVTVMAEEIDSQSLELEKGIDVILILVGKSLLDVTSDSQVGQLLLRLER